MDWFLWTFAILLLVGSLDNAIHGSVLPGSTLYDLTRLTMAG